MNRSKGSKPKAPRPRAKGPRPRRPAPPKHRRYLVPGERAVQELLDHAPERVKSLWMEKGRSFETLSQRAQALGIEVAMVSKERLAEEVGQGLARGVVAHASPPVRLPLAQAIAQDQARNAPDSLFLALDGVGDPQNFGAILRNAEFFGTQGVIWGADRAAPLSVLAVRASAGASERVDLVEVPKLTNALRELKAEGYWIVGTVADDGAQNWGQWLQQDPPQKLVIVMGNEHQGIRPSVRELCDFLVILPRIGALGSLNVSAATSAILAVYRALRPFCGGSAADPSPPESTKGS